MINNDFISCKFICRTCNQEYSFDYTPPDECSRCMLEKIEKEYFPPINKWKIFCNELIRFVLWSILFCPFYAYMIVKFGTLIGIICAAFYIWGQANQIILEYLYNHIKCK